MALSAALDVADGTYATRAGRFLSGRGDIFWLGTPGPGKMQDTLLL